MNPCAARPGGARVVLACPGVGTIRRGYETFARQCFDTLKDDQRIDLFLLKGRGASSANEQTVPIISRKAAILSLIQKLTGKDPYRVEQFTFFMALVPHLIRLQPDVVYVSDASVARRCLAFSSTRGKAFRVLFRNGAPIDPPYPAYHHIHQMTPVQFERGIRGGFEPHRMTMIPNAIPISRDFNPVTVQEKRSIRGRLGLAPDRKILLAVAAADPFKRLPELVREVALLSGQRPFLVVLGEQNAAMKVVERLALELMGDDAFSTRSVPSHEITAYYRCSDMLVHGALKEAAARVLGEALAQGLPVVAHDGAVQRFSLGAHGAYGDFSRHGECAAAISRVLERRQSNEEMIARHRHAYDHLSWEVLRERYVEMLLKVAAAESRER